MSFWFRFIKVSSALPRSGSIPLAGLSSARPLSFFIVPHLSGYVRCIPSLKLLIHFPPFFPWALPPLGYILRLPTALLPLFNLSPRPPAGRSYSLASFGYNANFQTCRAGRSGVALFPCSLARFRTFSVFQRTFPLLQPSSGCKPFYSDQRRDLRVFCGLLGCQAIQPKKGDLFRRYYNLIKRPNIVFPY